MILSAQITDFINYLQVDQKVSPLTIKNYKYYLRRFLEHAGEIDANNIDLETIRKFRLYLTSYADSKTKKPLKKNTQNYFMIAIRAFLKYLSKNNDATLPFEKVELAKNEVKSLKILDNAQILQLLEAPDTTKISGVRDRCILETLFSTGMKVSELALLNRDSISLLNSYSVKIIGRERKQRIVAISQSAINWLDKYLTIRKDAFKPLFIRFQGVIDINNDGEAMRLTTRSIERVVEKYVKKLAFGVKATPQTLRHSFATELLISGRDIKSVQEILGHQHVSTTQAYKPIF